MPSLKLYNLVALATVAIVASSFNAEPVQALATSQRLYANLVVKSHHAIAKQKRSSKGKRCRPKNNGNTTTGNSGGSTSSGSESSSGDNQGSTNTDTDSNSNSSSDGNNADQGSDNGDQVSTGGSGTEATTTAPPAGQTTTSAPPADQTTSTPPTDSTTTSAPPAGTPPATGGSKSGKVCLAWPIGNDPSLANFETSNSGVLYTWGPDMPANLHGYKAAPMLWSDGGIADFQAKVKPGSAEFILGFNEPEMAGGQANMTPERAAQVWKDVIQPLAGPNTKLISPAVTNAPQSKPWLQSFMDKCTDCKVDAVSVHFYGTKAENLIDYITDFHNTFKKPVWLTEYACQDFGPQPQHQCTVEETKQFMDTVKAFAEANDWVEQYCWFGAMHDMGNVNPVNQLLGADGKPTALGVDFLGL